MRFLLRDGPGMREGYKVSDPQPYVVCLECAQLLSAGAEKRRGLHPACESPWIKRTSVHPGNTKESDREAGEIFLAWLRVPSTWETPDAAAKRCAALGIGA